MSEINNNYESAYWDMRRKLENLKFSLTFIIALPTAFLIRIFIFGKNNWYLKLVASWELVDMIIIGATFLVIIWSLRKILEIFYPIQST